MAMYKPSKPPDPIRIDVWKGINEAVGQTGLKLGEALRQVNYRITKDFKPAKREGHKTFIDYENTKDVQGMWEGTIGSKHILISCNNGKVYEYDFDAETNTEIGTLTDAKTSILFFESKLLFFNGTDFNYYDGTTYGTMESIPYVPTVFIATPPAGGGTAYEPINLLTGKKKQEFQGDGVATKYYISETSIDSALTSVVIDGATKTELTHYTVNRTTGEFDFAAGTSPFGAPSNGAMVIPEWTKVTAGHADLVKKNKYATTFGPGNDTSIFLWGNPDQKNRRSWCASLNAAYFPVTYFTNIGTNNSAITDIKTNNANYQIIFKEDRTHYSYAEYVSANGTWDYPVKDLNEKVGNEVFNGCQIVNNNPVSIQNSAWWLWSTTSVEDERNADVISDRIRISLSAIDLSTAITFDYQSEKEYWCNVGSTVYIWNYGNDTMYTFDNVIGTCFLDIDGTVYYGSQGTIERMEWLDDNGVIITAQIDTGFHSFGGLNLIKTSDVVYVGLLPDTRASVTVYFKTNKINEFKQIRKKAEYNLLDFDDIDFDDYTFSTNPNPQPFPLEFSSNDYSYIQFRLENAQIDESSTILDFLVSAEIQGEV